MDNNTLINVVNLINSQINYINADARYFRDGLTESENDSIIQLRKLRNMLEYMIAKEATKEDFSSLLKEEE
jgi:hypothetical protein